MPRGLSFKTSSSCPSLTLSISERTTHVLVLTLFPETSSVWIVWFTSNALAINDVPLSPSPDQGSKRQATEVLYLMPSESARAPRTSRLFHPRDRYFRHLWSQTIWIFKVRLVTMNCNAGMRMCKVRITMKLVLAIVCNAACEIIPLH